MCVVATACIGSHYPYTSFKAIGSDGWAYGDTLVFPVEVNDSAVTGNLLIDISHDNSYPYSNLWLEVTYPSAEGADPQRDTVEITMCDPVGNWFGRGVEGIYQLETPLKDAATLADSSQIAIRHIMRVDTLRGISRIGLTLKAL